MYLFLLILPIKPLHVLCLALLFYYYTTAALFFQFYIGFLCTSSSSGSSGPSFHLLIFPCAGGRSALFQRFVSILWGPLFDILMFLSEPISLLVV